MITSNIQIALGAPHHTPTTLKRASDDGAPALFGCAVPPSSTSSLPAASTLHGPCPTGQCAHLRDCHFLPAQCDVLQRLLLHLIRTSTPTTTSVKHDSKHIANIGATAVQQRGERPASSGSTVQRSGCRRTGPVHDQLWEPGAVLHLVGGRSAVRAHLHCAVHIGHLGPLHNIATATAAVQHGQSFSSSLTSRYASSF